MSIPIFDADMEIIRKLDDEPNDVGGLTADELKQRFDEAGVLIQEYINAGLLPNLTAGNLTIDMSDIPGAGSIRDALIIIWQAVQQGGTGGGSGIVFSPDEPLFTQPVGGVWVQTELAAGGTESPARFFVMGPQGYVEMMFSPIPGVPGEALRYAVFPQTMSAGEIADFESDPGNMALWEGSRIFVVERVQGLIDDVTDAQHAIYQLSLRQYYDGKNVPNRGPMFFDGFIDASLMDTASTADRMYTSPDYCLNNWDRRFYINDDHQRNNDLFVGYYGGIRYDSAAQSYHASGPFRILSVSFQKEQMVSTTYNVDLSVYSTDGSGAPQSSQQALTSFAASIEYNGNIETWSCTPQQETITAGGNFALCLSSPTLAAASTAQYVFPHAVFASGGYPPEILDMWTHPNGGSWGQFAGNTNNGNRIAFVLLGSPVAEPPKWVTKEYALSRPCSRAVVYMTQDAASAGRIVPKLALYNTGETPAPVSMTRDTSGDMIMPGGRIETCWEMTVPTAKNLAQLTIQFDGIHLGDKVYEYGCILGS